jgi:hypothetical protein
MDASMNIKLFASLRLLLHKTWRRRNRRERQRAKKGRRIRARQGIALREPPDSIAIEQQQRAQQIRR